MRSTIAVILISCFLAGAFTLSAQSPEKFNYQAVVRDASGNVLANQSVSFRMSILQSSVDGAAVYVETHTTTSNAHGQVSLSIGSGTPVSGTFAGISWAGSSHFLKTEMDAAGGTSYVLMGTTQLLSVPYALYAKEAGSGGTTYTAGAGIDITGTTITNTLPNATHTGDATGSDVLTVVKLQGRDLSASAPSSGQVIKWNGSTWAPANETDPAMPSGTGYATLYHNGINWVTSNLLYNTNQRIGIGTSNPNQQLEITGNFRLPASSATVGNFYKGSNVFIHNKGTDNIYVGENSGNLNATASNNTGLGAYSLFNVTTGHSQTAIGSSALRNTTSGQQNTAIGYWAMYSNTTGSFNTALGYRAISANTSGTENVALGHQTLMSNSTGYANTAVGYQALINNSTGYQNTGIGDWALKSNNIGAENTAVGYFSLKSNTTGTNNTALGNWALLNLTTGINNTALGSQAGQGNTTGSGNVFIGHQAGANETGSNKLFIQNSVNGAPLIRGDFSEKYVGINTLLPHSSAVFEVFSNAKGVLLPKLTMQQMNAISDPDSGLIVYNTSLMKFVFFNGSEWREFGLGDCIPAPSLANATGIVTCTYPVTLNATAPEYGTGLWTIESGTGQIQDPTSPTSSFTGNQGEVNVLKWTVTTPCGSNSKTVIVYKPNPPAVEAGLSQLGLCSTNTVQLIGSYHEGFSYEWEILSGSGGSFTNNYIRAPLFTGVYGNLYVINFTVSNECYTASDSLSVSFNLQPTTSDAGPNIVVTSPQVLAVTLSGSVPNAQETGRWVKHSGVPGNFEDKNAHNTFFYVSPDRHYDLSWEVSGPCKTSSDHVIVNTNHTQTIALTDLLFEVYTIDDNADSIVWGGYGTAIGAVSDSNGFANTNMIVAALGNNGGVPYAAKVCYDLVAHGHDDWYLPSIWELKNVLYDNYEQIPEFDEKRTYLSSTETSQNSIATYIPKYRDVWLGEGTDYYRYEGQTIFESYPKNNPNHAYMHNTYIKYSYGNRVRCIRKVL
jgi:hypothetical protein